MDAMMLGAGAMVDEHKLAVIGLQRRVRYEEALHVLDMDDARRAEWYQENPALTSAVHALRGRMWGLRGDERTRPDSHNTLARDRSWSSRLHRPTTLSTATSATNSLCPRATTSKWHG